MTSSQLEARFKEHISKEEKRWKELESKLYDQYLAQGFNMWFAEVKAHRDVMELRSMPRGNSHVNRIPNEQTTQGDLD